MFSRAELDYAVKVVGRYFAPTPQIRWPLPAAAVGTEVWVKHEDRGRIHWRSKFYSGASAVS